MKAEGGMRTRANHVHCPCLSVGSEIQTAVLLAVICDERGRLTQNNTQ